MLMDPHASKQQASTMQSDDHNRKNVLCYIMSLAKEKVICFTFLQFKIKNSDVNNQDHRVI